MEHLKLTEDCLLMAPAILPANDCRGLTKSEGGSQYGGDGAVMIWVTDADKLATTLISNTGLPDEPGAGTGQLGEFIATIMSGVWKLTLMLSICVSLSA